MYQNPRSAIVAIANFLNISVTDEVIDNVVKHSTISEMRQSSNMGHNHLRQGGYGGWRTLFSVQSNEIFDEVSLSLKSKKDDQTDVI
jgi:hypothetical protein